MIISLNAFSQSPTAIIKLNGTNRKNNDVIKACGPISFNFQDGSTGNPTSWSWTFNGGNPSSAVSQNPGAVSFSTNGIHTVRLTATNGSGSSSMEIKLDVSNVKPAVDFSFTPDNICGSLSVNFTTTSVGESYAWTFGNTGSSSQKNPVHSFNIVGVGTQSVPVTLEVTNEYGCKNTATKNVNVIRIPDASLQTIDTDVELVNFNGLPTFKKCANDQNFVFNFRDGSTTKTTNTKHRIDWGDGTPVYEYTGNAMPNISHPFTIGNRVLTYTVTGAGGCETVRKYNVFLGTNPAGGINNPGNTNICAPELLRFPITGTSNNPPGTQYIVSFNDGSPSQTFSHPAPAEISHLFDVGSCGVSSSNGSTVLANSYKVTLDIINPCGISSSTAIPIYVSAKPKPRILFSPDSIVCANTAVTIQDISLSGNYISVSGASSTCLTTGGTVWTISPATGWTLSSGSTGQLNNSNTNFLLWDNGSASLNAVFNTPGNYTVKLYKGNQCGLDSTTRVICVREQPQALFSFSSSSGCLPFSVTATNQSPLPPCGENSYAWTVQRLDPENCATGSGPGYSYTNSTNASSIHPAWNFTRPGKYIVKLVTRAAGNSFFICPASEKIDTIYVKDKPVPILDRSSYTLCVGESLSPQANTISCYTPGISAFDWSFAGGSPLSAAQASPGSIQYNTVGDYNLKLTTTNECGSTEVSAPVKVVDLPVADAGRDTTVCSGAPLILGTAALPGYTYQWQPSTGLSNINTAQPVFTVTNNTGSDQSYQLSLTVKVGANGCSKTDIVNVIVRSIPQVSATQSATIICAGDSVLLTASGAAEYNWVPTFSTYPTTGEQVWTKPGVTTTYTITGTDIYGCRNSTGLTITVKPLPNTEAGSDIAACLINEEIPLSASPTGGVWTGPGISPAGTGYTFNPSVPGIGNYQLYYTATLNGCSSKDSLRINVADLQPANAGNDTIICQNTPSFQLKGLPEGGSWSGGNISSSGNFSTLQSGSFTLLYTYGVGSCRVSDQVVVTVLPALGNNSIQSRQDICLNATPNLIQGSAPTGGEGIYTYQWQESMNNADWVNIPSANSISYQPPALAITRYYRRIVSTVLCNGPQQNISNSIDIFVHPDAEAAFTASRYTGCIPFELNTSLITAELKPDRNGTYLWFADNNLLNTSSSSSFPGFTLVNEDQTAEIMLVVQSQWGCQPDTAIRSFITVAGATAAFTKNTSGGCTPVLASFTNTSSRLLNVQHNWDFGNGESSAEIQPSAVSFTGREDGRDTTYYITLTINNGCSNSVYKDSILVKPIPKAIFGVDATAGCSPMNIRINNTSRGDNASFFWDFGNGETRTTTEPGAFNYTYITGEVDTFLLKMVMTTECGKDSFEYKIVVVPNAIKPQIAVNGDQLIGCAPHTVSFINTTVGASRFVWDFGDGISGFVTTDIPQTINHTFNLPGIYTVAVRLTNNCSDTTIYRQINVYEGPKAGFSSDNINTCITDTLIRFTNTTQYLGADVPVFNWLIDGMSAGNSRDLNYRFRLSGAEQPPKNFLVQLVASNQYGCRDTLSGAVRMNPQPLSSFTVLNGNGCVPYVLKVNTSSQYADFYQWFVNDEPISSERVPSYMILDKASETYRISLVTSNTYGCASDTFVLSVATAPKPTASFEVSDSLSCNGVLDVRVQNKSAGARFYEWYFGDLSPREFSFNPARHLYNQTGEYDLMLVTDNGVCKDTAYKIMRVGSKPTALFEVDTALGCKLLTVNFRNLSSGGNQYLWDFGDGSFTGQQDPTHSFSHINSPYTIKLIAAGLYGCADTATQLNMIRVIAPPVASFRVLPSTVIELPQYSFRFFDQSTELKTPDYKWTFGDGIGRSEIASPDYTYTDTGSYQVRLIVINREDQCADTALQKVTILGIPGWLQVPNAFQPGSGRSELRRFLPKGTGLRNYRLSIYNSWGEKVFETTRLDDKGRPTEGWDGSFKGKPVQQDVYVWKIEAVFLSGQEWKGMKYPGMDYKKVGTITLIK